MRGVLARNTFVAVLLIVVLVVSGCSKAPAQSASTTATTQANENSKVVETATGGTASSGTLRQFTMTASNWKFDPNTITVNEGDTVEITVTATDVSHGFRLAEFGIDEELSPGTPVVIRFVADKKGTFTFSCSVPCGSGHREMKGTLIVQ